MTKAVDEGHKATKQTKIMMLMFGVIKCHVFKSINQEWFTDFGNIMKGPH